MRIGYFINQYPAATHTFIRREIRGMESSGATIFRYAIRDGGYNSTSVDAEDEIEAKLTKYILRVGVGTIAWQCAISMIGRPLTFVRALREAVAMGRRSDSGILRHLAYLAEAVVLASWCLRDRVEHIHAHFGTNSTAIAMLARHFCGIPYSFTAHGPEEFEKAQLLSLDVKLAHASFAVCVSSFGRSQLMRWSHPDQWQKIEVVHCGVDGRFLDGSVQRPPEIPRFVCVGRIDAWKGQSILVQAARHLRDAGVACEIVLVGDGPFRSRIEEESRLAGLEGVITVLGWRSGPQVKEEILASRTLILPSFGEGLPTVIMEAFALARPVISTYIAGIPELVENGATGWLVPAGNATALSQAMRASLETPIEKLEAMGTAGRRRVAESHDSLKEARKLLALVERVAMSAVGPEVST